MEAKAEAAAAGSEVPKAREEARGELSPITGDDELEDAHDAIGDCGGDAWWESLKVLCPEKLGDRTYDTVMPWC